MIKYFQKKETRWFARTLSLISELIGKIYYSTKRYLVFIFPSFCNNSSSKKTRLNLVSGFAILFAVLTASLLMSIGISIFGISIKELSLSTSSRDSQIAFYAADSARECALYWDTKVGAFMTYTNSDGTTNTPPVTSIICNGNIIALSTQSGDHSSGGTTFSFSQKTPAFFSYSTTDILSPEADLVITKRYVTSGSYIDTIISAYGHNVGIGAGKRIERGVTEEIINL
jgi:hypothetical protein